MREPAVFTHIASRLQPPLETLHSLTSTQPFSGEPLNPAGHSSLPPRPPRRLRRAFRTGRARAEHDAEREHEPDADDRLRNPARHTRNRHEISRA